MTCPRTDLMNEMCEYPCVFALYMRENLEKVERKGEREFALCPFQPSVFVCVSAPFSLSSLFPSFSWCQSSLSFCQFVFHLEITYSCFSNVNIPFCHHLCLPYFVSIYCHLFCFMSYLYCFTIIKTFSIFF